MRKDSSLELAAKLYILVVYVCTGGASYAYATAKVPTLSDPLVLILVTGCFAYLTSFVLRSILDGLIVLFGSVRVLPGVAFPRGIPQEHRTAVAYVVSASDVRQVKKAMANLEKSLRANHKTDLSDSLLWIYASDNQSSHDLVALECQHIKRLQKEFGRQVLYYFHREQSWGYKWGCYQDLMRALYEGTLETGNYLSSRYGKYGRRPNRRVFGFESRTYKKELSITVPEWNMGIVGDIDALRLGDPCQHVQYLLVSDLDVQWPAGSVRKLVEKMAHPDNLIFSIFQPNICIENWHESRFTHLMSWSRQFVVFHSLAFWGIHRRSQFFGKGGIRIGAYLETMLKTGRERLQPGTLSHDFVESLYCPTAAVVDVDVLEESPTTFFEELARLRRWTIGDIQGIIQEVLPRLPLIGSAASRLRYDEHKPRGLSLTESELLKAIRRLTFMPIMLDIWLIGTLWAGKSGMLLSAWNYRIERALYLLVVFGVFVFPKLVAPMLYDMKLKRIHRFSAQAIMISLMRGAMECLGTTILFLQYLYDKPLIVVRACREIVLARARGTMLRWDSFSDSGQVGSMFQVYLNRWVPTVLGVTLLLYLTVLTKDLVGLGMWSPILGSLVLGPALIWWTGRR